MSVELLTEHHFEFINLNRGRTGSSESTHVKMPHSWKSHVAAHYFYDKALSTDNCGKWYYYMADPLTHLSLTSLL